MVHLILNGWIIWVLLIMALVYSIFKPTIKGFIGEKTISMILSRLDPLEYKIINDVMLDINGKTSQIDHVVISNYGIFVIETKNYKGWILGDEKSEYWTQVIYKRKEKLYNPIRQNYGHVQALKTILNDFPEVKYIPIVVFSMNADLKVKTTSEVVYSMNLLATIRKYKQANMSNEIKEKIDARIVSLSIDDKKVKKQHVSVIQQNKHEKVTKIRNNVCPKCGGALIIRKGKNGDFKGCSNFPKCRFTASA